MFFIFFLLARGQGGSAKNLRVDTHNTHSVCLKFLGGRERDRHRETDKRHACVSVYVLNDTRKGGGGVCCMTTQKERERCFTQDVSVSLLLSLLSLSLHMSHHTSFTKKNNTGKDCTRASQYERNQSRSRRRSDEIDHHTLCTKERQGGCCG